jgi:hypothetical protein
VLKLGQKGDDARPIDLDRGIIVKGGELGEHDERVERCGKGRKLVKLREVEAGESLSYGNVRLTLREAD